MKQVSSSFRISMLWHYSHICKECLSKYFWWLKWNILDYLLYLYFNRRNVKIHTWFKRKYFIFYVKCKHYIYINVNHNPLFFSSSVEFWELFEESQCIILNMMLIFLLCNFGKVGFWLLGCVLLYIPNQLKICFFQSLQVIQELSGYWIYANIKNESPSKKCY